MVQIDIFVFKMEIFGVIILLILMYFMVVFFILKALYKVFLVRKSVVVFEAKLLRFLVLINEDII